MKKYKASDFVGLHFHVRYFKVFIASLFLPSLLFSQTTIFKETIGTYSGTISVASYTGWSNGNNYAHTVQAGTVVLNSSITASNYSGASGGTPVRVAGNSTWVISGINTINCSNITLSFGIHKSNFQHNGSGMLIEVSSDGTNYTQLSWTALTTGPGTGDNWYYRAGGTSVTGSIPTGNNLRIRFRNTSSDPYDFDDIELKATIIVPVNFLSVNVNRCATSSHIVWKTSDEQGVSHYEVQRSYDGNFFTAIGTLNALNNAALTQYSFSDQHRSEKKLFYRIVSVDVDGKRMFSKVIQSDAKAKNGFSVIAVQKTGVDLFATSGAGNAYLYVLTDAAGRVVQKGNINSIGSRVHIPLNGASLSGTYILSLIDQNQMHSFKIILGH